MRHRRVTVPPIPSSPPFRLWQRLVMVLLGLALAVALGAGGALYLYYRLSSGASPVRVLTERNGAAMRVQIEGRSADLVKLLTLDDGRVRFYPIADLADADQAAVKQLPVSLTVQYPFESTLTNQHARTLPVMILGRTADSVNFIRLSDHHTYAYAIAKLSAADQDFVKALPLSAPVSVSLPATAAAPAPPASAKAGQLVAKMQDMIAAMLPGSSGANAPGASTGTAPDAMNGTIFDPLPGLDATLSSAPATNARGQQTGEAELAYVVQVYQQIANVTTNLEQSLSATNPADDQAVEQQLLAAQTQLQQLYEQNGGAAPASPAASAPAGD
jgi:hypothetical protein